jgi:alkanesulfonate monooxygenase
MGSAECDVFAIYAEPRATTAERIAAFRRARCETRPHRRLQHVRTPDYCRDRRGGLGKGESHPRGMTGKLGWARQEGVRAPVDNAGRRQYAFAQEKELHDERLWMGITKATGALGNTSCLVGTAEQVADAILATTASVSRRSCCAASIQLRTRRFRARTHPAYQGRRHRDRQGPHR